MPYLQHRPLMHTALFRSPGVGWMGVCYSCYHLKSTGWQGGERRRVLSHSSSLYHCHHPTLHTWGFFIWIQEGENWIKTELEWTNQVPTEKKLQHFVHPRQPSHLNLSLTDSLFYHSIHYKFLVLNLKAPQNSSSFFHCVDGTFPTSSSISSIPPAQQCIYPHRP